MYDFVDGVKNHYASAKAAGYKFPMGTALLMHVMKIANPMVVDNNTLCELYVAVDQDARLAMESNAKELDLAMLALHNSLIQETIKDYTKSYS